ncbi:uncharacterized protein LOC101848562 isoform X2 [Aplysia californica]|uniref:Uncharacterized protein LOC101848562 isoform X2 n=1 Tax=Aplysia californica TaxID=6500 RepID=A0ABM0K9E9_APLCA|nr:uncharacterized protein LOC101848562 isoform X2 [Aplysia californica]
MKLCLAIAAMLVCLLTSQSHAQDTPFPHQGDPDDPHGGVPMGVSNSFCDNAEDSISIDWDPESTEEYTCPEGQRRGLGDAEINTQTCEDEAKKPIHKCYPEEIDYSDDPLPTSGPHRPLWPKYGEYRYVPPQRWLHSLEHGAIVFLYHPCADKGEVDLFRTVSNQCLRRHILSPYKEMPEGVNFVLLSWKCKLLLSNADMEEMVRFVRDHALRAPEGHVYNDGQYSKALLHPAKMVSNIMDTQLCPHVHLPH